MNQKLQTKVNDMKQARFIDFLSIKKWTAIFSGLMLVISIFSITIQGLNFGIDFTGGTLVELQYPKAVDLDNIRQRLESENIKASVVYFGSSEVILIQSQTSSSSANLSNQIFDILKKDENQVELNRVEFIGPKIGKELIEDGSLAVLYALVGILAYVLLRFEFRFAIASVLTLVHDVVILLGIFSVFNLTFDLTVLAACLATLGYSLNDTIVIFDRIRENFIRKDSQTIDVINNALNQSLSRTLVTSLTTLLVLVSLLIYAGEGIFNFALTLTIGVIIGTYSSIYISSALLLVFKLTRNHLLKPEIDEELKNMP